MPTTAGGAAIFVAASTQPIVRPAETGRETVRPHTASPPSILWVEGTKAYGLKRIQSSARYGQPGDYDGLSPRCGGKGA